MQNLVKELSDELLSMTNQSLKPLLKDLIDVKNESGITNLQYASKYGHADQVRILLELGADFNLKNAENQNSLHFTLNVIGGWLEIGPNYHIRVMFDRNNMGQ